MPFSPAADCEQCLARMHDFLDLRQPPASDPLIQVHVETCERCRTVLGDWQAIDPAIAVTQVKLRAYPLEPASIPGKLSMTRIAPWTITAVAACWMCIGSFRSLDPVEEPDVIDAYLSLNAEPELLDFQEFGEQVRQPNWWGSVATASWRPVAPIADGIRPLTNSFQTALQLLTPRIAKEPIHQPVDKDDVSAGLVAASIYA